MRSVGGIRAGVARMHSHGSSQMLACKQPYTRPCMRQPETRRLYNTATGMYSQPEELVE